MQKTLLTPKQASQHPQIPYSVSKIYKLIHFNKIPYFKEDENVKQSPVYVYLEDVLAYMTRNRIASEFEINSQSAIAV
jgi:hypothetical protein